MKKIFIRIMALIVVVMMANGVGAQQLTEQQAKERAMRYLATHDKEIASRSKGLARAGNPSNKEHLTSAKVGAKSIYAFNCEGGGYVIASADSRALPVLGYSDTGSIDWEQMPENMRHRHAGQPTGLQGRGYD